MAVVPVTQVKLGDKLSEDVVTQLGGTLFQKGKFIIQRDIDILQAFLVQSVSIASKNGATEPEEEKNKVDEPVRGIMAFFQEYDKMFVLLKRVFTLAYSGGNIPILEIRTTMEGLLTQIHHYNILSFNARNNSNVKEYIYHNSIMVALTSFVLAKWHGFEQKDLIPIALGGLFHDIGNVKVDSAILEKPSRLTSDELEEMKKHTLYGYSILKNIAAINEGVKLCALQHHERDDGSGYPLGVKGDKIHAYAKVVSIADMFHAMTSNRQHKKGASPYLVLEQLFQEAFGKLDPAMVQTFINKVTQFTNGTLVRLSDNRIGEIVFSDRMNPTRPMVNVNGQIINLVTDRKLFIQGVVPR